MSLHMYVSCSETHVVITYSKGEVAQFVPNVHSPEAHNAGYTRHVSTETHRPIPLICLPGNHDLTPLLRLDLRRTGAGTCGGASGGISLSGDSTCSTAGPPESVSNGPVMVGAIADKAESSSGVIPPTGV